MTDTAERFDHWAIIELMGHVRRAGRLTEYTIAGQGFLRLEIPDDVGWVTQYISPNAVYAIIPTTEGLARAVAAQWFRGPERAGAASGWPAR